MEKRLPYASDEFVILGHKADEINQARILLPSVTKGGSIVCAVVHSRLCSDAFGPFVIHSNGRRHPCGLVYKSRYPLR